MNEYQQHIVDTLKMQRNEALDCCAQLRAEAITMKRERDVLQILADNLQNQLDNLKATNAADSPV